MRMPMEPVNSGSYDEMIERLSSNPMTAKEINTRLKKGSHLATAFEVSSVSALETYRV